MKNQQTIMCDVKACKYHNGDNCCCNLSKITVTPCEDCETAHYCGNYVKNDNYKKTNSINTRNNEILRILRRRVFA